MKFLAAVTICLVLSAGAQANFLDDLKTSLSGVGDAFKQTFSGVVEQGKTLGTQLLGQLSQQGTQLLGQAAQSLLLNVMNNLQSPAPAATKKRDLASLVSKAESTVQNVKQMFTTGLTKYQGLFETALNKLNTLVSNMESLPVDKLVSSVDSVVATHNSLADNLLKGLVQNIAQQLTSTAGSMSNKRDLSSLLGTVTSGLEEFLKPNVDVLKQILTNVGDNLKQTATQMQGSVDQTVSGLTQQVLGHLSNFQLTGQDLLSKSQLAVNTLKTLVDQSLKQ
ncbi:hypothetical protein KUTeg_011692 [Tegillarca granosa]|uniref:Uncharacterized protein n=1 Tax=Tegillarca granosa TaxID=220873 RepID=A0ABQ9F0P0_TEGGR|nr:hypothetical protein KUTeg_011692 [Tegillarca granosa]